MQNEKSCILLRRSDGTSKRNMKVLVQMLPCRTNRDLELVPGLEEESVLGILGDSIIYGCAAELEW